MTWARLLLLCSLAPAAWAAIEVREFAAPAQEQRFQDLVFELRCPKCQNQNIADSNAPLSADLRQKVYDMIQDGHSDEEIVAYLVQRYGDFVSYRPPLKRATWLLWFGPLILIALVGFGLALWIRRCARAGPITLDARERERVETLLSRHDDGAG